MGIGEAKAIQMLMKHKNSMNDVIEDLFGDSDPVQGGENEDEDADEDEDEDEEDEENDAGEEDQETVVRVAPEDPHRQVVECLVCMEEIIETFCMVPCGHTSCCGPCLSRVDNCPLCRARITQRVRIFL